jgi:type I restriction enzyme S subunit
MVRSNYKKTVLGWIPEDWNLCKFGDIPDQKIKWSLTGGPFGSDLKSSDYTGDKGVRIIQLQNIGDGKFLNTYKIFTSEKKADQLIGCNIYPGELIMSKMGDPVTRTCIIPDYHERYLMASDGIRLVPDNKRFDRKFVLEYINFKTFRNIAVANSTGSTRQRIGLGDLKKLPFICPPLPEQQKIAAILNAWDKAIDTLNKLISEKEQLKKGLMQQLLTGKKRFAGFTDKWKEVKLGEVFSLSSGKTKPSNTIALANLKMNIPVYGGNGISGYTNEFSNSGDLILIGRVGEYCGAVHFVKEKCWITDNCLWANNFSLDDDTLFFFYLLAELNLGRLRNKGGQPLVSQKPILNLKIAKPKLNEQQMIAAVLSAADKEIALLKNELTNLTDQKKGLMQKLLTGEVRVKTEKRL